MTTPTFQNPDNFNLYWLTARTNKQLRQWCQDNGFSPAKNARKDHYIALLQARMAECGIDQDSHPDAIRARA
jgi:hypothetical protein